MQQNNLFTRMKSQASADQVNRDREQLKLTIPQDGLNRCFCAICFQDADGTFDGLDYCRAHYPLMPAEQTAHEALKGYLEFCQGTDRLRDLLAAETDDAQRETFRAALSERTALYWQVTVLDLQRAQQAAYGRCGTHDGKPHAFAGKETADASNHG